MLKFNIIHKNYHNEQQEILNIFLKIQRTVKKLGSSEAGTRGIL